MVATKRWLLGLVLVLAMGAAVLFALQSIRRKPDEVRVGYMRISAHVPVLAASDGKLDIFKKHGLAVRLEQFNDTPALMKALESGRIDVAYQVSPDILWAAARGGQRYHAYFVVESTKDAPVDGFYAMGDVDAATLRGKKVGAFPGPTASAMLRKIMKEAYGLGASDYELVSVPPPLQLNQLKSGEIAGLFTYEPLGTLAIARVGAKRVLKAPVTEYVVNPWVGGVGVFSDKLVTERPKVAKEFQSAIRETVEQLERQPELLAQMTSELQPGLTPDLAAKIPLARHSFSTGEAERSNISKSLSDLLEAYKKLGITDGSGSDNVRIFVVGEK